MVVGAVVGFSGGKAFLGVVWLANAGVLQVWLANTGVLQVWLANVVIVVYIGLLRTGGIVTIFSRLGVGSREIFLAIGVLRVLLWFGLGVIWVVVDLGVVGVLPYLVVGFQVDGRRRYGGRFFFIVLTGYLFCPLKFVIENK